MRHKQLVFFFAYVVLSLMSVNIFIFNQGWYNIQEFQSKLSLGLSWTVFFAPSILAAFFNSYLNKFQVNFILRCGELGKVIILLLFYTLCSTSLKSSSVVIITSFLLGILFVPFYPSVYKILKILSQSYSNKVVYSIEIFIQLSTVFGLLISAFLFELLGFLPLTIIASVCAGISFILLYALRDTKTDPASADPINPSTNGAFDKSYLAVGASHLFPQVIIYLLTISFILTIESLGKGPVEFSFTEIIFGIIAILISSVITKFSKFFENHKVILALTIVGLISLATPLFLEFNLFSFYIFVGVLALVFTSLKNMARSSVISIIPSAEITKSMYVYQAVSYSVLIVCAFTISYLITKFDYRVVYYVFLFIQICFLLFFYPSLLFKRQKNEIK